MTIDILLSHWGTYQWETAIDHKFTASWWFKILLHGLSKNLLMSKDFIDEYMEKVVLLLTTAQE